MGAHETAKKLLFFFLEGHVRPNKTFPIPHRTLLRGTTAKAEKIPPESRADESGGGAELVVSGRGGASGLLRFCAVGGIGKTDGPGGHLRSQRVGVGPLCGGLPKGCPATHHSGAGSRPTGHTRDPTRGGPGGGSFGYGGGGV